MRRPVPRQNFVSYVRYKVSHAAPETRLLQRKTQRVNERGSPIAGRTILTAERCRIAYVALVEVDVLFA